LPLFFLVLFFDFPPRFNVCCSIFFLFANVFLTCRFVNGLNIFSAFEFSGTTLSSLELSTTINFGRFLIVLFFFGMGDGIDISSFASVAGINSIFLSNFIGDFLGSTSFVSVFDNYNSNKTTRNGFVKNTFTKPFQSMPIVISQVASFKGRDFVLTRTKNINQTSFQCSMQEAEILDNLHTKERIDWCAFSSGTYRFNGKKFECGIVKNVNHNSKTVSFTKDFFTKQPNLLTRCSTYNGSDPANTRIEQTLSLSFNVRIQEETSRDAETKHVNENVSYIAVEEE